MKMNNYINTDHLRPLGLAALLVTGLTLQAQTYITTGEVDLGIAYDEGTDTWDLHAHDEVNDIEYAPEDIVWVADETAAAGTVPAGSQWSFLGTAGSSIWTFPATQNPSLPFVGIATEEIDPGIFVGDALSLRLKAVTGPGNFFLYNVDEFAQPTVFMNSADGITVGDTLALPTGSHQHFNWVFNAVGEYTLTFEAFGNSVLNGSTSSGDVDYFFSVQAVPEPSAAALLGVGLAALWSFRRRAK